MRSIEAVLDRADHVRGFETEQYLDRLGRTLMLMGRPAARRMNEIS